MTVSAVIIALAIVLVLLYLKLHSSEEGKFAGYLRGLLVCIVVVHDQSF